MKDAQKMVNRSSKDRRHSLASDWKNEERRTKDEKRERWLRDGKWRSTHKPIKLVDLSHSALL